MSPLRSSLTGILLGLSLVAGCVQVLGIEDAECDPGYSRDCLPDELANASGGSGDRQTISALQPSGTGGSAGAGGSAPTAAGAGGGTSGAVSAMGGAAGSNLGAAGSAAMPVDPIVARASQLCLDYCDTVQASCTDDNQQFASQVACLAVCELLQPGTAGASSGNTVQCRLARAQLATSTGEPANYCYSAGPGGGGVCGTDCEGYCTVMTAKCTQLGTFSQCLSSCSSVPDLSLPPTNLRYDVSQQSGDSLQCRLFHVSAASVDPVGHCPHAAGQTPCN